MQCKKKYALKARKFHESTAATADKSVLPAVLECRTLRCTIQVHLGSNPLRLSGGTPFSTVSRRRFMKHPGWPGNFNTLNLAKSPKLLNHRLDLTPPASGLSIPGVPCPTAVLLHSVYSQPSDHFQIGLCFHSLLPPLHR